jgi:hypothetical protein
MKQSEPNPRGFVENAWYEAVARIAESEPRRFFLFSPQTKHCLRVYLELKVKAQGEYKRAA